MLQIEPLADGEQRFLHRRLEVERIARRRLKDSVPDEPHLLRRLVPRAGDDGSGVALHAGVDADPYREVPISHHWTGLRVLARRPPRRVGLLTDREREVLQLIAEGKTNKEIATRLDVSVNTVETHRKHTMEKLDLHNTAEVVRFALRKKIVE